MASKRKKSSSRSTRRTTTSAKAQGSAKMCGDMCKPSHGCCFYFLGFLGAAIYYIATATGFWVGVWGVIKALVWPAFLVFHLMRFLGM